VLDTVVYRSVTVQEPQREQRDNGCYLITADKHMNNTQAIARQLLLKCVPVAMDSHKMIKVLLDYNNGNSVFYVVHAKVLEEIFL
jgi:hypothetical protein